MQKKRQKFAAKWNPTAQYGFKLHGNHQNNVQRDRLPRRRLAHTDILAQSLPQIAVPVAAIYGAHDALYKAFIGALADKFRAVTPHLVDFILVPDSGHWVQYEEPQQFMSVLLPLLQSK